MKTRETFPGKTYSVHTANGCTVSDDSGWSKEIDAPDGYFTAHGSTVYLSDDEATMREVFKLAPVVGGSGGGGLPKTDYLIYNSDYTEVRGNMDNLENGTYFFYTQPLTSWDIALPALTKGEYMFSSCPALTTFNAVLPALTKGEYMFYRNPALTTFTADLPALTNGRYMFYDCPALTTFTAVLPVLTSVYFMFYSCTALTTFTADLPVLTIGQSMFDSCPALTTFNAVLPALTNGSKMFNKCQLNKESALRVLNSIPAYTSGSHPLTIGIHIDHQTDEEVLAAIANAEAKGWTLTVQWNGTATSTASVMRFGQLIYAKGGEHELPDGTTERVLDWGHYVTDETGYETFRSLESAYAYFGLPMPAEESQPTE